MACLQPPADRKSSRVAIVYALPREADAITLLFDQFWGEERDPFGRADGDTNTYITKRIGEYRGVLAMLPNIGTNNEAATTANLRGRCTVCFNDPDIFCEIASKASCAEARYDVATLVVRERSTELAQGRAFSPEIFIGRVGSGNTVIKSGEDRDRIATEYSLIAFEIEGAGAWDEVPYIVIKGICDYTDSHKNKVWQDFAAATAVSIAKAILGRYAVHDGDRESVSHEPDLPNLGGQRSESDTRETHPLIPEGSTVTYATLTDASINSETSLFSENPWSQKTASTTPSSVSTCGMATHMSDCREFPSTSILATDYKETTNDHNTSKDDIQSIASMDGDITSNADSGPVTAPQRHAAVNYLVEMLTKDKDLKPILLWSFVEDLRLQRVLIPSQDITISFLGGRRTRDQLSLEIFNTFKPAGDRDRERTYRQMQRS
ncbi:hypothetical protein HG530_015880 [Fusarium avenaceum]|nr:hypothetical protein HG530_015880 [Fusarium avenaceum]